MKIAIYGTGPIGSTFAFHMSAAGHEVTCIARGARLAQLRAEGAILTIDGRRAPITPAEALDPAVTFDLVIVTVLAHKVAAILPALEASAARTIMFMFNQFETLSQLRDAVGPERVAFGFPAILASLEAGKLRAKIYTFGQKTIASDCRWAELFTASGIAAGVERDMQSWLRTHAVAVAIMMSVATAAYQRGAGLSFAEAKTYARALREGFDLIGHLGDRVRPVAMKLLIVLPVRAVAAIFFVMSRTSLVKTIGAIGADEPRALVDNMLAAASVPMPSLCAIRP
jgi:2-dehydropantoate 2-reductase